MSPDPPIVPFSEFVSTLRQLCRDARVGTLFITSVDNRTASLTLLGGEIVGARYRALRGRDTLVLIKNIGQSRIAFSDDKVTDTDPDLPPTAEILALLGGRPPSVPIGPPAAASPPVRPPPPAPSAAPPVPRAPRAESERIRTVLEAELVEYLGPMAKVICREHIERAGSLSTPGDLQRLVEGLAREIGDAKKEERFKREAWNKLPWFHGLTPRPGS